MEWDQTTDITKYFTTMKNTQVKFECWGITIEMIDMINAAMEQIQDSGIFDHKFLCQWEQKDHRKTWGAMKEYYTKEYRAIKQFEGANIQAYEKINNIQETKEVEVSNYFEEFCRYAIVGREQIQQMSGVFKGASDALSKTME